MVHFAPAEMLVLEAARAADVAVGMFGGVAVAVDGGSVDDSDVVVVAVADGQDMESDAGDVVDFERSDLSYPLRASYWAARGRMSSAIRQVRVR
jgi:hypothetical protein